MDLNDIDFSNLKLENIGNWPLAIRAVIVIAVAVGVLGAGYYLDTLPQLQELERAKGEEVSLKEGFEQKQSKAASFDDYKQQIVEMQDAFGSLLRQLPGKNEVADLLVDITQSGIAAGLESNLFKPEREVPRDFYAELPIKLEVNGSYHQLGQFVSNVAALPRIVTLHEINITKGRDQNKKTLTMSAVAKTYRYLDEKERARFRAAGNRRKR